MVFAVFNPMAKIQPVAIQPQTNTKIMSHKSPESHQPFYYIQRSTPEIQPKLKTYLKNYYPRLAYKFMIYGTYARAVWLSFSIRLKTWGMLRANINKNDILRSNIESKQPRKRNPSILLYDVPNNSSMEEI
ncbi:hypothetical protein AVEN_228605-1 [Araneus ventricosus]|uniref:Uncharacterized protein n=1 Tax=Araneus ventricosus TaxID=182803 RepID=A0A4Y2KHM0_ARAVE|nr:hypothetical protein AVEN_228605-1 [Araneus ventricosus]